MLSGSQVIFKLFLEIKLPELESTYIILTFILGTIFLWTLNLVVSFFRDGNYASKNHLGSWEKY